MTPYCNTTFPHRISAFFSTNRIWLALVLMALAFRVTAQPQLLVSGNVNISRLSGNQSQGAIAIDPTNPNRLFTAGNVASDLGVLSNKLFAAYSTNAGTNWIYTDQLDGTIADGTDGLPRACCDPSVTWDTFGNLFLAYINAAVSEIDVLVSTNGGVSFSLNTKLAVGHTNAILQPTIVASKGSSSNYVWITYRDEVATNGAGVIAQGAPVTGLGAIGAFSAPKTLPTTTSDGGVGDIAIGPSNQVMVVYQNPTSGQTNGSIYISVDPDGAGPQNFGARIKATATGVGGYDLIPAQTNRWIDAEAGLAWDTNPGSPRFGRVYLVYADETPDESNNTDIYVRYSDNVGTTWSAAVKVNDDSTTNSQFLPRIAIDPTTGYLAVSWYDCRNDFGTNSIVDRDGKPNTDAQIYAAVSTNGGVSFSPNVKVSAGTSDFYYAHNVKNDYGDYSGLAFYNGNAYPIWADNSNSTTNNPGRTNTFDLYTAKIVVEPADLGLSITPSPNSLFIEHHLTYSLVVSNRGPGTAANIRVTNYFAPDVTFISATNAQGTVSNYGTYIVASVASLTNKGTASVSVVVVPHVPGITVDNAEVASSRGDPNPTNNTASATANVKPPIDDLAVSTRAASAFLTWNTYTNGTTQVLYGLTPNYGNVSTLDSRLVTNHIAWLTGLQSDATYYFKVISRIGAVEYSLTGTFFTPSGIILDNPDAFYSGVWTIGTGNNGHYGDYYQYTPSTPGSPTATALYTPNIPRPGKFEVALWYPAGSNQSANVPVLASGKNDNVFVQVDQTSNGGQWNLIAHELDFDAGTGGFVVMANDTGESGKVVVADAVRFAPSIVSEYPTDGTVPNWWAEFYFGTNYVDGAIDSDGDGYSNYKEFVLGTIPTDATSRLQFRFERLAANSARAVFTPFLGARTYRLQYLTDVGGTNWATLPIAPVAGSNGEGIITLASPPAAATFHRLSVQLAP